MQGRLLFEDIRYIHMYTTTYREAVIGQSFVYKGKPESTFDRCSLVMKKEGIFVGCLLKVVVGVLLFVIQNISCD